MKRTGHARVLLILAMPAIHCTIAAKVSADDRRYLPASPNSGTSYGSGSFTHFDRGVNDAVKNIDAGQIKFDYNTVVGSGFIPNSGGAALAGGFFMNPDVIVKPGFTLHWMQLITSHTTTGTDGRTPPYPDAPNGPGQYSPVYPYESLPNPVDPAPNLSFQDFPMRPGENNHLEEWEAELALTCASDEVSSQGFREVRVAASFFWGFRLDYDNINNPTHVTDPIAPGFWANGATTEFLNSFNARFRSFVGPPANGQQRWDFSNNTNCFDMALPEPSSGLFMLVVMTSVTRRNRRKCHGLNHQTLIRVKSLTSLTTCKYRSRS